MRLKEAGIYADFKIGDYHKDPAPEPSLSSSIAKLLIYGSPLSAKIAHPRLNPDFKESDEKKFDIGSTAHEILFGRGRGLAVLPYEDWRTKAAKDARAKAIEKGLTPVKAADHDLATDMAEAAIAQLRLIPECEGFFDGKAIDNSEVVCLWSETDERTKQTIWMRSLMDRLHIGTDVVTIWDLKTTSSSASPWTVGQHLISQRYDVQAAMYERAIMHLVTGSGGRIRMRFIVQENWYPYLLSVVELDAGAITIGQKKLSFAIDRWRRAIKENSWPAYPARIIRAAMPEWEEKSWLEREQFDVMLKDDGVDAFAQLVPFKPHAVRPVADYLSAG